MSSSADLASQAPSRPLRDCGLLLLLAVVPALLTAWLHPKHPDWAWSRPAVEQVTLDEVSRWAAPVLWVDAREAGAYAKQHVPGAVLLNETEWNRLLPGFLAAWRPESRVVVYCNTGQCDASEVVALRLRRELNLTDVFVLKGGWSAWQHTHP